MPPIEVQERIVEVLDTFTSLISKLQNELKDELQARKQQYDFYRDKLLTFKRKEPM